MLQEVSRCYVLQFSGNPQLYFSPGRINLIGEHVDYNDGFVMPAAIDKGVYYAIAANGTNDINIYSYDFRELYSTQLNKVGPAKGWPNYLMSVVNEFKLLGLPIKGFNAVLGATVPRGSGLSSSAAVEGGLAYAINELFGCGLDRVELAKLCQRAEHNYPGVQCGIMDQFANLMGKKNHVVLLDCCSLDYQYYPLELRDCTIVLINSKVHHSLASTQYNQRRKQCEAGLAAMQLQSFRDVEGSTALEQYRHKMDAITYKRCEYVIAEIERAQQAAQYLQQHNLTAFGALMYATHDGLSQQYEVSCPELDFLVTQAKQNPQVAGARMMGGGFGGCSINLVQTNAVEDFLTTTCEAYQQRFNLTAEVYAVGISEGVHRMTISA